MKKHIHKWLFALSALLLLVFLVVTTLDYLHYDSQINSAPFSVFILIHAIEYVLPAAVLFAAAWITRKLWKK